MKHRPSPFRCIAELRGSHLALLAIVLLALVAQPLGMALHAAEHASAEPCCLIQADAGIDDQTLYADSPPADADGCDICVTLASQRTNGETPSIDSNEGTRCANSRLMVVATAALAPESPRECAPRGPPAA